MRVRRIAAIFFLLIGAVWILQGLNILKGSSMTGDAKWAVAGVVMAAIGVGFLVWDARVQKSAGEPPTESS